MEKISHRITLDVHKGGIQKVLHGMFTGDVLSRKIVISLVAGSAVCNMDENTTAVMYVTKPSGVTNYGACTVEGNLVTYDILPADIDEPGITQMQLKVVSGEKVLYAPVFSVEAQKSSTSDTPAETSPQFSALEQALAQVEEVYNKRIVSVEVEEDYTFVVTYADGETYTSDAFKALMEEIEKAEHERAEAEVARDVAEENRELAESARASSYADMQNDIQSAIDANTALYNRVEELADEGLITESRVVEIIEEQGGGGGGGTVVLPDNVLVASDVTAADVEAPKNNADLFGSLPPSDYAKTTDVNAIKNGTTQVGNAKTLDGHGAEYFARGGFGLGSDTANDAIAETIVTDLNNATKCGWYYVSSSTTNNIPSGFSTTAILLVSARNSNNAICQQYFDIAYQKNAIRFFYGGSWTSWEEVAKTTDLANYLPLISNAVNTLKVLNNTVLKLSNTGTGDYTWLQFLKGDTSLGFFGFDKNKAPMVSIDGIASTLLHTGNMANHVLPLTGGTVGNGSKSYPLIVRGSSSYSLIDYMNDANDVRWGSLGFAGAEVPVFLTGDRTNAYRLLHTGNKPTGTYTGNGSTATRTINIGGIGKLLHVFSPKAGCHVILGAYGGTYWRYNGTVGTLKEEEASYNHSTGVFSISTDSFPVNNSGYSYEWNLL
ncbi:MAG: hypothetical protein IKT67_13020 [Lachnospiraceae bacterium]|nr:hypothetical protein [Lachnospiraceae bacterium]